MVTTLRIKCPHCQQSSEIFLSTSVSVIILNCPSCLSPIMYFKRKVVLLDPHVPEANSDSCCVDAVPLLDKQAKTSAAVPFMRRNTMGAIECGDPRAVPENLTEDRHRKKYITEDDCTNLRIELELCADSKHFIERL